MSNLKSTVLQGGNEVGVHASYPQTYPVTSKAISGANQQQLSSTTHEKNLSLPLHLIGKKHSGPDGKNVTHQSYSMRNDKDHTVKQSTLHQQTITADRDRGNLNEYRNALEREQYRGERNTVAKNSQESLKKMTINESEQQISNYHITRPVMSGSPLAALGYATGNSNDWQ